MNAADLPLPPRATRVERSSAEEINARIERETLANIERVAAGGREAIDRRLEELDREWDIERTLEANAATITLVALGLGFSVDRRWFALPRRRRRLSPPALAARLVSAASAFPPTRHPHGARNPSRAHCPAHLARRFRVVVQRSARSFSPGEGGTMNTRLVRSKSGGWYGMLALCAGLCAAHGGGVSHLQHGDRAASPSGHLQRRVFGARFWWSCPRFPSFCWPSLPTISGGRRSAAVPLQPRTRTSVTTHS